MNKYYLVFLIIFHLSAYSQSEIETVSETIHCGSAKITFFKQCGNSEDSISWVHVHENEKTAVRAMAWLLDSTKQGCFVSWQCQNQRYIDFSLLGKNYRFDPNRIYTAKGLKATLQTNSFYSDSAYCLVSQVAKAFIEKFITGKKLIVALHNNTENGGLTINSYKKGSVYGNDACAVYQNSKKDPDDFFYTTEPVFFSRLKKLGYNVVLQDNSKINDDGSLSVYCAKAGIPYLNIEAQDGHLQQQKEMLNLLLNLINDYK